MVTGSQMVHKGLAALVSQTWPIPPAVHKRFLAALTTSPCSRVVALRHQLALLGFSNLDAFFRGTATPRFMMLLCEDLVATRLLTRHEASQVQEAILSAVTRDGRWLDTREYEERKQCLTSTNSTNQLASIAWYAVMASQIFQYATPLCLLWSR